MIPVAAFAGKQVAIFGLGSSGLLSARALKEGGADVVVFDDDGGDVRLHSTYDESHGDRNLISGIASTIEETLEMTGAIVFIRALLRYLAENYSNVRIRFER